MRLILFLLLLPVLGWCPPLEKNPLIEHLERVNALFKTYRPSVTAEERLGFAVETFRGSQRVRELQTDKDGNCRIVDTYAPDAVRLAVLSAISIMETNDNKRLQYAYAFLGGHRTTQIRALEEVGMGPTSDLDSRIYALSYHFSRIHERHKLIEKACRIWNQGIERWWTPKARDYWLGVKKYKEKYDAIQLN